MATDIIARGMAANAGGGGGGDYPPAGGIPKSDLASAVQTSLGKADSAYQKPGDGIPKSAFTQSVQESLSKADELYQLGQRKAIEDEGGYFTTDTVEGALQELGAELAGLNALLGSGVIA